VTPAQPPAEKRKTLLAFYVGMGAVLALAVAFYFAWTPLRVWYWEREVRQSDTSLVTKIDSSHGTLLLSPRALAAMRLVDLRPRAFPALKRLLHHPDEGVRRETLFALEESGRRTMWAFPLLIEVVGKGDFDAAHGAVRAAEKMSGRKFVQNYSYFSPELTREQMLRWWEREGTAKYGGAE
jgi:hypothetical protein